MASGVAPAAPAVVATVTVTPDTLSFPGLRAGRRSSVLRTATVTNAGSVPVVFTSITRTLHDYFGSTTCFAHPSLAVGNSCTITTAFLATASGERDAMLVIVDNAVDSPQQVPLFGIAESGYYLATVAGEVLVFGDAGFHGDLTGVGLRSPLISLQASASGDGYWMPASDGGVFSFGSAPFFGSPVGAGRGATVSGMITTVDGGGYLMASDRGIVFHFGNAPQYGDLSPGYPIAIVAIASTAAPLPVGFFGGAASAPRRSDRPPI